MSEVAKKIGYAMSLRTPQKEALSLSLIHI